MPRERPTTDELSKRSYNHDLEDLFLEWYDYHRWPSQDMVAQNVIEYETTLGLRAAAYCSEKSSTEYLKTHSMLAALRAEFEETGNPLALIEAYTRVMQEHWYPPDWVLVALHDRLGKWCEDGWQGSLDKCFGLDRKRGQRSSWMTKRLEHQRNAFLCQQMHIAKILAPYLDNTAIARLICSRWALPHNDVPMISASTLKGHYERTWKSIFDRDRAMIELRKELEGWPEKDKVRWVDVEDNETTVRKISCLYCDKLFVSRHRILNRLCRSCRKKTRVD